MRIKLAIPDRLVTPDVLEAALEATALANEVAIQNGEVPALTDAISKGVRWRPEPFHDGEHFDLAEQVVARKWGDCDDLAPWLAGELRASGEDPGARPRVYKTGEKRWHVVTELSDGRILDPSRWAGMTKDGRQGVSGSVARPFARPGHGALAVVPHDGAWWSRCDLPWPDALGHMASHARATTPERALQAAIHGAVCCGEAMESPLTDRAMACARLLLAHPEEVADLIPSLRKSEVGRAMTQAEYNALTTDQKAALHAHLRKSGAAGRAISNAYKQGRGGGTTPSAALRDAARLTSGIPGGGLANTALSSLTHGAIRRQAPKGAIVHPSGGVSLPLEDRDPGHGQHMFISYHPAGQVGPVVMRF